MAHHQNQNGFTWKKKKRIACITVQYRRVITMDLKVKVAAGKHVNTKPSWFFFSDENPDISSTNGTCR